MSTRDLAALPKGHLHIHLEAAMRPATLTELAAAMGVDLPETTGFTDFTAFADMYRGLLAVLRAPANLERLIDEAVADAAADGVVYIEFGVSPDFHADTYGSAEAALDAHLAAAAAAGRARYGARLEGAVVGVRTRWSVRHVQRPAAGKRTASR